MKPKRQYVVKTYVEASSAAAAIRQAKKQVPDEVELVQEREFTDAIGFRVEPAVEEDDED